MKILITSGGTSEAIDRVRSITNHSTGRLGKHITESFLQAGFSVTLVTTKSARKPDSHPLLDIIEITNVKHLVDTLEPLVQTHDVLIHSMAVSDYTPTYMTSLDELKTTSSVETLIHQKNTESKISSAEEYQVLFLKKTPKVISLVKKWNPAIHLIGFKLLVDVSREHLIEIARQSLKKNQADYILANDLSLISKEQHPAYLVGEESEIPLTTKEEIAHLLVQKVTEMRK